MFGCGIAPKSAEKPGGIIPTGTNHTGADRQPARAEKINLVLGDCTTGGGTDLNRFFSTRARDTCTGSRPGTAASSRHTPAAPIPRCRERHGNGGEGKTKKARSVTREGFFARCLKRCPHPIRAGDPTGAPM